MTKITYEIVQHDGGWAYRVSGAYSETFASHEAAHKAAESAARLQMAAGEDNGIVYEDENGHWHYELAKGTDRPETDVKD